MKQTKRWVALRTQRAAHAHIHVLSGSSFVVSDTLSAGENTAVLEVKRSRDPGYLTRQSSNSFRKLSTLFTQPAMGSASQSPDMEDAKWNTCTPTTRHGAKRDT